MVSRTFWRVGFAVYLVVVVAIGVSAYMRWLPSVNLIWSKLDFVLHFVLIGMIAFFLDGLLGFRPLFPGAGARWSWLRLAPVLVLVLAGLEELAQSFSPYRSCSWSDFVADLLGVCFFSWLARRFARRGGRTPGDSHAS